MKTSRSWMNWVRRGACALVACTLLSVPNHAIAGGSKTLLPTIEGFQQGLIDLDGKRITDLTFDRIDAVTALSAKELGWVAVAERKIDENMQVSYKYAIMSSETGKLLTPFLYDDIVPLCPGYVEVSITQSYMETSGEEDAIWRYQYPVKDWGVVRITDGKEIIPVQEGYYSFFAQTKDGYYFVGSNNGKYSIINERGETIIGPCAYLELYGKDGFLTYETDYYSRYESTASDFLWTARKVAVFDGYIVEIKEDTVGNENIIKSAWDFDGNSVDHLIGQQAAYRPYDEGSCVALYMNDKVALGSPDYVPLTDFVYDDVRVNVDIDGNQVIQAWKDDQTYILDTEGNELFSMPEKVFYVGSGYIAAEFTETGYNRYNDHGDLIMLPPCDDSMVVAEDRYLAMNYSTYTHTLVNGAGDILIEEIRYTPMMDKAGNMILCIPVGRYEFFGLYNTDGEPILNAVYNSIQCVGENLYQVRQGQYTGYIDSTGRWLYKVSIYQTLGDD